MRKKPSKPGSSASLSKRELECYVKLVRLDAGAISATRKYATVTQARPESFPTISKIRSLREWSTPPDKDDRALWREARMDAGIPPATKKFASVTRATAIKARIVPKSDQSVLSIAEKMPKSRKAGKRGLRSQEHSLGNQKSSGSSGLRKGSKPVLRESRPVGIEEEELASRSRRSAKKDLAHRASYQITGRRVTKERGVEHHVVWTTDEPVHAEARGDWNNLELYDYIDFEDTDYLNYLLDVMEVAPKEVILFDGEEASPTKFDSNNNNQ